MIPSVIATQVRRGIEDFLRVTYTPEDEFFKDLLEDFFKEPENLFRGPFYSLQLPFRAGKGIDKVLYPEIPMKFMPHLHQEMAYERLSSAEPKSTIVATGTGSGKTECFMYPLLDYCYKNKEEKGIKAIIVYPMNALATDQAKRFAKEIFKNPNLKGNVSVGLFIGGQHDDDGIDAMTKDSVITCKNTIRDNPPSILMTNYKMLDYLLIRPIDYKLWRYNKPETLKYIVVDELHTFDGPQGTDLACLLRRITNRLKAPENHICYIGTSATLGNDETSMEKLTSFATKLFGSNFDRYSVITENIIKPHEFLGEDALIMYSSTPTIADFEKLKADSFNSELGYVKAQCKVWFDGNFDLPEEPTDDDRINLGNQLKKHAFFQNLIRLLNKKITEEQILSNELNRIYRGFTNYCQEFQSAFIDSIFALVSFAKRSIVKNDGNIEVVPFLFCRVQLWLRELKRMVVSVEPKPKLKYAADIQPDDKTMYLPVIHCRTCGKVGWFSHKSPEESCFNSELNKLYSSFFHNNPSLHFIFHDNQENNNLNNGRGPRNRNFTSLLCGHCLSLNAKDYNTEHQVCCKCGNGDKLIPIELYNDREEKDGRVNVLNHCPYCNSRNSLTIVGSRAASLISVAIGQLFSSPYNNDKKLLTFSDSVQDASHRAGFFTARTYKANLRAAIQQVVDAYDGPINLDKLPDYFFEYWFKKFDAESQSKGIGGLERFVEQFIPSQLEYLYGYKELLESGKRLTVNDDIVTILRKRIHWEIFSEYAFRASVGRTLEKSGCSITLLKPELLNKWSDVLLPKLKENFGELRALGELQLKRFLVGFIRRLRLIGAVYTYYFNNYFKDGDTYKLDKFDIALPSFYKSRPPVFVKLGAPVKAFENLTQLKNQTAYCQNWMIKCFGRQLSNYEDVFRVIMKEGTELGIFIEEETSEATIWGLLPDSLIIDKNVDFFVCKSTGHTIPAPHSEALYWNGCPSDRTHDNYGVFELKEKDENDNFYGRLYKSANISRVIAKEHTGLLERKAREDLEQAFINGNAGKRIAAPNILSCTPTLEMGINIGSLSSVVLCSVPPNQANFLQRIGRAGRLDGNAFNLVLATGNPHDLHFFAEPSEMFAGNITPPGVFLNAPSVLERQLIAFCFDKWVESSNGDLSIIPEILKPTLDNIATGRPDETKFPYNFFNYLSKEKRQELHSEFCSLFEGIFQDSTIIHLSNFILGDVNNDGLDLKILNCLESLVKDRKKLSDKYDSIMAQLRKFRGKVLDEPTKEEQQNLKFEKEAVAKTKEKIDKKQTYNFFTDEGLMPNYAFPEAGVKLISKIYSKNKNTEEDSQYKVDIDEYERSGKSAIQEFAPGNAFYVDGRKLVINQIDIADDSLEIWHFCAECAYVEEQSEVDKHTTTCPRCGSASWADESLKLPVLRMRSVIACMPDKTSRSFDESDEREPVFYNKHMLPELKKENVVKAFQTDSDDFAFGFEYLKKATFRDINFGRNSTLEEEQLGLTVAGKKISKLGFRYCKTCGGVEINGEVKHNISCKCRHQKNPDKNVTQSLFLYRKFESEAVRLLLPMDELDIMNKLPSFIAAINMGLKEKFEGDVSNIQVAIYDEPIPKTNSKKNFLILYDQVPGGTGYLKELTSSPANFMDMLQKAYNKLKSCSCSADPEKDGCYNCLHAYRNSRDLPRIKRSEAMEILETILNNKDNIKEIPTVEDIVCNPMFDSELEKRFIVALAKASTEDNPVKLTKRIYDGKTAYGMTIFNRNHEIIQSYKIVPQVELGDKEGVKCPSKPDFVIYPLRQSVSSMKPIAVFTDGYEYHGDINSDDYALPQDLQKRMAIVRSGKYTCWSLTYDDVVIQLQKDKQISNDYFMKFATLDKKKLLVEDLDWKFLDCSKGILEANSFKMLVSYLIEPDDEKWQKYAINYAVKGILDNGFFTTDEKLNVLKKQYLEEIDYKCLKNSAISCNEKFGPNYVFSKEYLNGQASILSTSVISKQIISNALIAKKKKEHFDVYSLLSDIVVLLRIEDATKPISSVDYKYVWNGMLNAYNILQFLPQTVVVTTQFVERNYIVPKLITNEFSENSAWHEVYELADPEVHSILDLANKEGWAIPFAGFELTAISGEVLADAELAWVDKKVVLLLNDSEKQIFIENGWQTFVVTEDEYVEKLSMIMSAN